MIELLDQRSFYDRQYAVRLADTLHNLGVISDHEFDLLLFDMYERYGDTDYGDIHFNDDI